MIENSIFRQKVQQLFVISFQEYGPAQFLSHVLYECVSQEKPEVLSVHFAIEQVSSYVDYR